MDDLVERARLWSLLETDPEGRRALLDAVAAAERGDRTALVDLVDGRLRFGTAGLRGPLGPGPRRLNVVVAEQTAAGIARVLLDDVADAASRGVLVGRDGRHGSAAMAAAAEAVFRAHGLAVAGFDGPVPTPLVASTLAHGDAAAAIVVTASHNPAADNGIKVYWADGAQIVAPLDARIAAEIDRAAAEVAAAVAAEPDDPIAAAHRVVRPGPGSAPRTDLGTSSTGPAADAYVERALVGVHPRSTVPLALTSMHGVGADLLERLLRAAGHDDLHVVAEQRDPDPDFPTVAFPNPEEPGALDRLVDVAAGAGCAAGLANDPDADRLALVVPDGHGAWRALTGDEVGAVLCHHLLERDAAGAPDARTPLVATTVVSSQLAGAIARAAGAHAVETLTGFKWLCRPAMEHPEWRQVLAYEEALGYAVGPDARDKDGITAALAVADLVAGLAADGRTVLDLLDDLHRRHGAHVTRNGWTTLAGPDAAEVLSTFVRRLADAPLDEIDGRPVVHRDRPAPDVLRMWTDDGTRLAIRPSGTEPKLKHYCEAVVAVDGDGPEALAAARAEAGRRADGVVAAVGVLLGG
ncbi:phospho-sugar mutase [Dermatobacter hominis]|uniref:phospho-sugar mutase n=1 Tax=Dermatobacter hominis TaxID=2884263 RepID=UPI001D0F5454|nr:phospho-sugar mutase [Dermatobacter hominis]UDY37714.1 phospho-sugar mutase [Dermatobacter hominis]